MRRAPLATGGVAAGPFAAPPVVARRTPGGEGGAAPEIEAPVAAARGGGRPLSDGELAFFQPRLGADLGGVRLHDDARAHRLAAGIGARAFTTGHDVFLGAGQYSTGSRAGRHLLAHELTHTVQQAGRAGVVQRYTTYSAADQTAGKSLDWKHPAGTELDIADDGTLARGGKSRAWATKKRIEYAESVLKAVGSDVKLEVGSGSISGLQPRKKGKGGKVTLEQVDVVNRSGGGRADLTADCGTAARQIMGIDDATQKFSGVMKRRGVERYTTARGYHGNPYTTPQRWVDDIYKQAWPGLPDKAARRAKYAGLTAKEKKEFDKKYGLNEYAVPEIGQSVTTNRPRGWNFHFAGAILKGGADYITAENVPGSGRDAQSWYFEIYGPASKSQSFHYGWSRASGSTTMVVESLKARQGKTTAAGVHLVRDPKKWKEASNRIGKLALGDHVDVIAKGANWRKVEVKTGTHAGKTGWIMSIYYALR